MKQRFKSKNIDRAAFLVRVIAARDGALLDELIESLRCMPAIDAHQILDAADAVMPVRDHLYWEAFLEVSQAVRVEVEPFI